MWRARRFIPFLELIVVGAVVALTAMVTRYYREALVLAVLFWPLRRVAMGRWSVRTPLDVLLPLLLLMVPVALWASAVPEVTEEQVYRLLLGVALFYAVVNWATTPARIRWAVRGTFVVALALVGLSWVLVTEPPGKWQALPVQITLPPPPARLPPVLQDTVNPNVVAGYVVLFGGIMLAWGLMAGTDVFWGERLLALLGWGMFSVATVLLFSRGALMAMGAAWLLVLALSGRWGRRVLLIVGAMGALSLILLRQHPPGWWLSLWGDTFTSLLGRENIWVQAVALVQDFAFTGVGLGTFPHVVSVLYPSTIIRPQVVTHAHNLFLQVAVDLGLPGALAWGAMLMAVVWCAVDTYRHSRGALRAAGAGWLAMLTALVVHGSVDAVPWVHTRPAALLWALWGITVATWRVARQPLPEGDTWQTPRQWG